MRQVVARAKFDEQMSADQIRETRAVLDREVILDRSRRGEFGA